MLWLNSSMQFNSLMEGLCTEYRSTPKPFYELHGNLFLLIDGCSHYCHDGCNRR